MKGMKSVFNDDNFCILGGGNLRWVAKKLLHVDGLISAQGGTATVYTHGAGSGGSLLLEVTNMTGLYFKCHFPQRVHRIVK